MSVLSLVISACTGVVDVESIWKVTPGMAVLTVFELLSTEMPSTVKFGILGSQSGVDFEGAGRGCHVAETGIGGCRGGGGKSAGGGIDGGRARRVGNAGDDKLSA